LRFVAPHAVVFGCEGLKLSAAEASFFRTADPVGFILFQRNCADPEQVRALTAALRDCTGRADTFVLIDQEGGRVQRLKPPHWRRRPAMRAFGTLHAEQPQKAVRLAWALARAMAADLHDLGITVDCAPVLDRAVNETHDAIGDRSAGSAVAAIAALGNAQIEGFLAGGVLPMIKHVPGHGRAQKDSHHELPVADASAGVLEATDFAPFRRLNHSPFAMTGHVVFPAIDPDAPATLSAKVVSEVIRGAIGFDGCLLTDDVSMKALTGGIDSRARRALAAGCDVVLHCNGKMAEMEAAAGAVPRLDGDALRRVVAAQRMLKPPKPVDIAALEEELAQMFGAVA
jgi:beta-N-acetylhexosaminidase